MRDYFNNLKSSCKLQIPNTGFQKKKADFSWINLESVICFLESN
jgi:hypothetical protein